MNAAPARLSGIAAALSAALGACATGSHRTGRPPVTTDIQRPPES